jgi:hypothetical protein
MSTPSRRSHAVGSGVYRPARAGHPYRPPSGAFYSLHTIEMERRPPSVPTGCGARTGVTGIVGVQMARDAARRRAAPVRSAHPGSSGDGGDGGGRTCPCHWEHALRAPARHRSGQWRGRAAAHRRRVRWRPAEGPLVCSGRTARTSRRATVGANSGLVHLFRRVAAQGPGAQPVMV